MKIKCEVSLLVMCKNEKVGADGKSKYYNLAVLADGGEAGNVSCNEDVYNLVSIGTPQRFLAEFNEQYKSFRLVQLDMRKQAVGKEDSGQHEQAAGSKPQGGK